MPFLLVNRCSRHPVSSRWHSCKCYSADSSTKAPLGTRYDERKHNENGVALIFEHTGQSNDAQMGIRRDGKFRRKGVEPRMNRLYFFFEPEIIKSLDRKQSCLNLALSFMDTRLYWNHCPQPQSFVPQNAPNCNLPGQVHPVPNTAPPDPQRYSLTPRPQQPIHQPSRSRVPNPERFLGASCQWVYCNSGEKTPMLAYAPFSPSLPRLRPSDKLVEI